MNALVLLAFSQLALTVTVVCLWVEMRRGQR